MVALEALERIPFFNEFDQEERKLLASISESRSFKAGETIFEEGATAGRLQVLVSGLVSLRQKQKGAGTDALLGTLDENADVFGIGAALGDKQTHSHSAICLEASEVVEIDADRLLALCEENPRVGVHFLLRLTGVMAQRLAAAREQIRSRVRPGLISHG